MDTRTPCRQCGPGYYIGGEGCRHTAAPDPWAVFPTELLDAVVDKLPDRRCCPPDDPMPHRHPCPHDRDTAGEILEAIAAAVVLCSQCGERPSAMLKLGTADGWCTTCLDLAAEPPEDGREAHAYREARRRLRMLHTQLSGRRQDWANNTEQPCSSARAVAYQSAMSSVASILDEVEAIAAGER